MPQDNKKNKPHIESLLSKQEAAKLSELIDIITHVGNNPALLLIGTDSSTLGEAFVDFVKHHSPIEVKPWTIDNQEVAFTILKNAEQLSPHCFHVLCFFKNDSLPPDEVAANLVFYRDYIPQYRLKIVIIAPHLLLKTIIAKAYDFYSISSFYDFFTDFSQSVQRDLEEYKGKPGPVLEYENNLTALMDYRNQKEVIPAVLLKKLFNAASSAQEILKLDEAFKLYQEALKVALAKDNTEYQAVISSRIGNVYYAKGHMTDALNHYNKALQLTRKINDLSNEATILGQIGLGLQPVDLRVPFVRKSR